MTFDDGWVLLTISAMAIGFFVVALFDRVWLKVFKIKTPKFPFTIELVNISARNKHDVFNDFDRSRRVSDATFPGSPAWYSSRESDPFTVGSTAWYARKNLNSL